MNISFENKRVLVTGAGRGIGREVAKAFAACKAEKIFALSRTKSHLDELVATTPNIIPVLVDLCDWDATKEAVEKITPVDILVNNAGTFIGESFLNIMPESFDKQFTVNLKSVINVSQVVAKGMIREKKSGCIINVSSQASQMALKSHAVYGATKSALDGLTRVMALELGDHNIRVVAVNPTVVYTEMGRLGWSDEKKAKPLLDRIPLHKFAEVEDVVNVILFLASDKAAMINATAVPIEGGILAT